MGNGLAYLRRESHENAVLLIKAFFDVFKGGEKST
jgi:hypothetical protein